MKDRDKAKKIKELNVAIKKMKAENAREFGDYTPKSPLYSLKKLLCKRK